jgi:hypothetical protein
MALTNNWSPADNLIGTGSSLELQLTSDNIVESIGFISQISFNDVDFDDVMVGTTITVNGITFTCAAVADLDENEFTYSASSGVKMTNFFVTFGASYYTHQNLTLSAFTGTGFTYSANKCGLGFTVKWANLDNGVDDFDTVTAASPLTLKSDFAARVQLRKSDFDGDVFDDTVETIISITNTETSDDECLLNSHQLSKNIGELINSYYNIPLPRISDSSPIIGFDGGAFEIGGIASETHGQNTFQVLALSNVFVFPGRYKPENSATRFTGHYPAGGFDFLTPLKDGDTISSHGLNWLYAAYDQPVGKRFDIRLTVYDTFGATHTFQLVQNLTSINNYTLEILGAPCQYETLLTPNFDACDVVRIVFDLEVGNEGGGALGQAQLDLNVVHHSELENFIFKNSFGYYSGITTRPFLLRELEAIQEYVSFCEPHLPTTSSKNTRMLSNENSDVFTAVLHRHHSENYIKEFLGSKEVYWYDGTNYYSVQLVFESGQIDSANAEVDTVFQFKIKN